MPAFRVSRLSRDLHPPAEQCRGIWKWCSEKEKRSVIHTYIHTYTENLKQRTSCWKSLKLYMSCRLLVYTLYNTADTVRCCFAASLFLLPTKILTNELSTHHNESRFRLSARCWNLAAEIYSHSVTRVSVSSNMLIWPSLQIQYVWPCRVYQGWERVNGVLKIFWRGGNLELWTFCESCENTADRCWNDNGCGQITFLIKNIFIYYFNICNVNEVIIPKKTISE